MDKQSTKCLKFGEILLDENRKSIFLCAYCTDFMEIGNFIDHLKSCERVEHIFKSQTAARLKCDTDETKLIKKVKKDAKELVVYEFEDSRNAIDSNGDFSDFLSIEAELLDPKWYVDTAVSNTNNKSEASYNELIEEVTPFVQFKENLKANRSSPRISRISTKEAAKNQSQKIDNSSEKKKAPPKKVISKNDKKQTLRRSTPTQVKSKLKEDVKQAVQKKLTKTKGSAKNPILDTKKITKIIVHETTQRAPNKRKAESLPSSAPTKNVQQNVASNISKRRKTLAHNLQTSLQSKPVQILASNLKDTNAKPSPSSLVKETHISPPVTLPLSIQLKHEENNLSPEKITQPLRRGRSDIQRLQQSSQSQRPQQSQKSQKLQQPQQQIKLQTNPNRSQQSVNHGKVTKNCAIQIPTKEPNQPTPIQVERKISSTQSFQTQQTATTSTVTNNNQKTAEILNKLQTLGLKVQRTNSHPELNTKTGSSANNCNEKALEIIKRLQSKGMNVKIVQKPKPSAIAAKEPSAFTVVHCPILSQEHIGNTTNSIPCPIQRTNSVVSTVLESKPNFHKNILIKKCN